MNVLNCPACGNELTPQPINPISLHVCDEGCGGLWIDWVAPETCDALEEPTQAALTICKGADRRINQAMRFNCPHCANLMMNRRYIQVNDDVLVDECPSCGGFWLSGDEVEEVRNQFDNAPAHLPELQDSLETDPAQLQSAQRFRQICRFLCGGQSVPQKQS